MNVRTRYVKTSKADRMPRWWGPRGDLTQSCFVEVENTPLLQITHPHNCPIFLPAHQMMHLWPTDALFSILYGSAAIWHWSVEDFRNQVHQFCKDKFPSQVSNKRKGTVDDDSDRYPHGGKRSRTLIGILASDGRVCYT